jgi:hypothetical protein
MDIEDIKRESVLKALREYGYSASITRISCFQWQIEEEQKALTDGGNHDRDAKLPTIEELWDSDYFFEQVNEDLGIGADDHIVLDEKLFPDYYKYNNDDIWDILHKYVPEYSDIEKEILKGRNDYAKEHNLSTIDI